jgi:hypothetical protein
MHIVAGVIPEEKSAPQALVLQKCVTGAFKGTAKNQASLPCLRKSQNM